MVITIIGLGLMGGSAAIDLDNDRINANAALNIGLVDEICELEEGVNRADLVLIAIPADAEMSVLPKVLDIVDKQFVTDMCSTKGQIAQIIKYHKNRKQYVAAHPMAGTEYSGPWAAISGLFDGKRVASSRLRW